MWAVCEASLGIELSLDQITLPPALVRRLILAKMDPEDSEKRPICRVICRLIDLEQEFDQKGAELRAEFISALVKAAGASARGSRCIYKALHTDADSVVNLRGGKALKPRRD